ncbi:MAG: hypothetical protein WCT33_02275 [Patescibacteria group bacterium]
MKKLALILGAIVIALFCLVVGNWYFSKSGAPATGAISETEAVDTLKTRFPELKSYPSDNLPSKSVATEKADDGWYIAFVQEGSGVPVIDAQCFLIKNDKTFSRINYVPQNNTVTGKFSAKECMLITNTDDGNVNSNCALETCHGLNIKCGANPPEACTMMYAIGDKCLQYAECGIQNGECQPIQNSQFTQCASCVQNCIDTFADDNIGLFECESNCN